MAEEELFSMIFTIVNWNGAALRIDIECQQNGYSFKFWDANDESGSQGNARSVIRQMQGFNADFWEGGIFRKKFEFPLEEDSLYQYIAAFNNRLSAVVSANRPQ